MTKQQYLTSEGVERFRTELEQLKGSARDEIAKRLRSAIEMGDLSENADYHAAKEQQGFLEGRIQELEYLLKQAVIIDAKDGGYDEVALGARVTIQDEDNPPETYTLVGAKEADPRNGRISNESPFGSALLGGHVGDEATVHTPSGEVHLRILKIE